MALRAPKRERSIKTRALSTALIPLEYVERSILVVRGQRVMLDADLAALYGVPTKRFNEQVKRNQDRFPEDFRFQLTQAERDEVVANCDHLRRLKFSPVLPWAFTEHGAIMAANVLNSARAVRVSILIVRAFVRLRHVLATHKDLARRIDDLEKQFTGKTAEHDAHIRQIYAVLNELLQPPVPNPKGRIGFQSEAPSENPSASMARAWSKRAR